MVQVLARREDEQPEVPHDHDELRGRQVLEARERGVHAGARGEPRDHPGRADAPRGQRRERDDGERRQDRREPEEPRPRRAVEEGGLVQDHHDRQGERDLLRPHGEERGRDDRGATAEARPIADSAPVAEPPRRVQDDGREVEQGRERGEPLHDVRDRLGLERVRDEHRRGGEGDRARGRREGGPAQAGRSEREPDEGVDEERVRDVDEDVHEVVAGRGEPADAPVEREGEVADVPPREPGYRPGGVGEVAEDRVVADVLHVVEHERAPEGVRVGEQANEGYRGDRERPEGPDPAPGSARPVARRSAARG